MRILPKVIKLCWFVGVIPKLGIWNILYVQVYRLLLKTTVFKHRFSIATLICDEPVFRKSFNTAIEQNAYPLEWKIELLKQASNIIEGRILYYSRHWIKHSTPPNWFINPFNGKRCKQKDFHWTRISDFNNELGDIKNIWEISRFSWLSILSRAYVISGDEVYVNTMNSWIEDWIKQNPVNQGPNWKCGQEASFRVFYLMNALFILNQWDKPSEVFVQLIDIHLKRIYSNIRYAIAQRNNHATSEAAALFIGGNWLVKVDSGNNDQYRLYAKTGRKKLEFLVPGLVYEDGCFAQHSVNYHRLFIDTLSMVLFWKNIMKLHGFSDRFYTIAQKSLQWLTTITDESGGCSNIGSNDGTLLQNNHSCSYLDFRPSIQVASYLINGKAMFKSGPWNEALYWFGIKNKKGALSQNNTKSSVIPSGYAIMKSEKSWALLHYPNYKFRPSHNDVFHFDLWVKGKNVMHDSGSFSYNPDEDGELADFKSVQSHNTLSFDHQEQMPRLSRFLLGKWIKPLMVSSIKHINNGTYSWEGTYKTYLKNHHYRSVVWHNDVWEITDKFSGPAKSVEIGFNFEYDDYTLDYESKVVRLLWGSISISGNVDIKIKPHKISKYYMSTQNSNRLIISTSNNAEVITTIKITK
jgi:hypothetical protein